MLRHAENCRQLVVEKDGEVEYLELNRLSAQGLGKTQPDFEGMSLEFQVE